MSRTRMVLTHDAAIALAGRLASRRGVRYRVRRGTSPVGAPVWIVEPR